MDADLRRRVDALRRPLELAAADGFAGVRRVAGLGNALRAACDGLIARLADARGGDADHLADDGALAQWRTALAKWEQLAEHQQAVEVARGMRLIARFPSGPAARPGRASDPPLTSAPPRVAYPPPRPAPSLAASAASARADEARLARPRAASPRIAHAPTTNARADEPRTTITPGAPATDAPRTAKRKAAAKPEQTPADPLGAPTHTLPGIGPAFAERLAEKGLETVEDLLWCLPRRYDDVRDAKPLGDVVGLDEGTRATFVARVASSRMVFARGRRWAEVRLAAVDAAPSAIDPNVNGGWFGAPPASAVVRWFNVWAGIEKRMPAGATVTLSGVVRSRGGRCELANPDILAIELPIDEAVDGAGGEGEAAGGAKKKALPTILARYPDVAGVPASKLRAACQTACTRVGAHADDGVPASVERAAGLPALPETLARLHAPAADI